ncbi:hypothetical protein [Piscinibacter sakaiensis]|uniref:hypothetical protein n=1 Tax=Piscinibacter sakaiensis TaxID=1547922 RepID=UPI003AAEA2AD
MLSTTAWKATVGLVVGSITASEDYRVIAADPTCSNTFVVEVAVVVFFLGAIYCVCAYGLLGLSLHESLPARSWRQAGATFATSIAFGAITLFLAPVAYFIGHAITDSSANSGFAVVLRSLAAHPNIAGAILGSFVFMLSAQLSQGLAGRVFWRHRSEA